MLIPVPTATETEQDYLDRCMADAAMTAEYPDEGQRTEAVHSQWERRRGKSAGSESTADERPIIAKNARRLFHVREADLQAKAAGTKGGPGWIEGYLAVWDNVDLGFEIMRKGTFAKSVAERVNDGPGVPLMVKHMAHGGDVVDVIGTITQAKEDDYGLWIHAELSSVPLAQETRTKILEGHVRGLSVGFMPVRYGWLTVDEGREVLEHTECKLVEGTITVKPMNPFGQLTEAKSLDLAVERLTAMDAELRGKDLDVDALRTERSRIIEETFGGRENVDALGKAIADLGALLSTVLTPIEPDDTTGASEGESPATPDADVHRMGQIIDLFRCEMDALDI